MLTQPKKPTPVTEASITNDQIHSVRKAMLGVPRKKAYHRAILADCGAALNGDKTCRAAVADAYNKMAGINEEVDEENDEEDEYVSVFLTKRDPVIKPSWSARLVTCSYCDRGFRRVSGIHIGSQRLGMISDVPCERVFASHGGSMTDVNERPWMAYVDGDPIRKKRGDARRFSSATAAYAAARKAAPKRWHP